MEWIFHCDHSLTSFILSPLLSTKRSRRHFTQQGNEKYFENSARIYVK